MKKVVENSSVKSREIIEKFYSSLIESIKRGQWEIKEENKYRGWDDYFDFTGAQKEGELSFTLFRKGVFSPCPQYFLSINSLLVEELVLRIVEDRYLRYILPEIQDYLTFFVMDLDEIFTIFEEKLKDSDDIREPFPRAFFRDLFNGSGPDIGA